jgi:hypothetical protein
MILKVIFAQRQEGQPEQYALEALHCVTEYEYRQNPSWWDEKLEACRKDPEYVACVAIDVDLDEDEVMKRLVPEYAPVEGTVKPES